MFHLKRSLHLLECKIFADSRLFKELLDVFLGKPIVLHAVTAVVARSEGSMRQKVENEKRASGREPLTKACRCEDGIVKVMEAGTDTGNVKRLEVRAG